MAPSDSDRPAPLIAPVLPACSMCGGVTAGHNCPAGTGNGLYRFVHREVLLLVVLSAIAGTLFAVTRAAAAANRRMHLREAAVWFGLGREHQRAGRTTQAAENLRRATVIDRDNATYRLALAEALAAGSQYHAARHLLLGLRERAPDDPQINMMLARIEARRQDRWAAVRYYQSALYGSWPADRAEAQRELRVELIRYLVEHGDERRALSQIIVLSGNLPREVPPQVEVAQLFMSADDPRRALDHYRQALAIDPDNRLALAGAGEAAFALGDYNRARGYLRRLPHPAERPAEVLALANLVLGSDPMLPGLSREQRRRRLVVGLKHATARLQACHDAAPAGAGAKAMASLQGEAISFVRDLTPARLRRAPEAVGEGLDLIGRMERAADASCGGPVEVDRALTLIAHRYREDSP